MSDNEIKQTKQCILWMCTYTLKSVTVAMVLGYALLYLLLSIPAAEAATLRSNSSVAGSVVHLSDVFDDLPNGQDAVLGSAPEIGKDMILGAKTLSRIASAYHLDWTPASATDQCILRRESSSVSSTDIENSLKEALIAKGVSGDFTVTLSNLNASLVLPRDLPATVEVSQLSYTPGRDVFSATLAAPSADNPVKTINVSGIVERSVQVPVLRSSLKSGEIIGSTDIEWIDVSAANLGRDVILDADHLVGKTPIRSITIGHPVRGREVTSPQLVARGDDVLIFFNAGPLELSAKGRAMQNGAEGDLVRVMNLSSNKSVTAEVTGDHEVRVE